MINENLYDLIDKVSNLNNIFGILVICIIAGSVLVFYSRQINRFFKPVKLVLQICTAVFLSVGLVGLTLLAVSHVVNEFYLAAFLTVALVSGIFLAALYVINRKSKNLTALQKEFSKLNDEKIITEKNLADLTQLNNEIQQKIHESENIFSQEKSDLENRINALTSENDSLKAKISELNQNLETANSNVNNLQDEIQQKLHESENIFNQEKSNLENQINALTSENDSLKTRISELNEKFEKNNMIIRGMTTITNAVFKDAKEFNGHHYKIFEQKLNWDDAKTMCESLGGHLATITSQEEYDCVEKTFITENPSQRYWLGGFTTHNMKTWHWITSEKWLPPKWKEWGFLALRENYIFGEGKLLISGEKSGTWTIGSNKEQYNYICEWDF